MLRFHAQLGLIILLLASSGGSAWQTPKPSSPEELAFDSVKTATNPATRMAAAEDFVAKFPNSAKRSTVASLVSEQLTVLRNPEIAISLLDRARMIFTSASELEYLKPAALEVYVNGNRTDEAFALAEDLLSRKPYQLPLLIKMTHLGAQQARNRNLTYASPALVYGFKAIDIIEKDQRPAQITDEDWAEQKSQLPFLYQQVALIKLAQTNYSEAKTEIHKAIQLAPNDPANFALLGRVLSSDYQKLSDTYDAMTDGESRQETKKRIDALLDEIIESYARAAGLATGKTQYTLLLQQVVPDLTRYYQYRHNQSTVGLRQLIDKYRFE